MHRLHLLTATEDYRSIEDRLFVASTELEDVNTFAAAAGFYELGEIRRLRGDLDGALAAFGQARSLGTDPQPGEALVWTSQGDTGAAWTALQASLAWQDRIGRMPLLRAAVEVALLREPCGRGRGALPRTGIRRRSLRDSWLQGLGRACPRGGPGAPGPTRRGSRRAAGRVARVPNSTVPVRNGRGLRMDGGRPQGVGATRSRRRRYRDRGEHLPPARCRTSADFCAAVACGADAARDRRSDRRLPAERRIGKWPKNSSSATRRWAVIWRTSTPSSESRRALRPSRGRTQTRS